MTEAPTTPLRAELYDLIALNPDGQPFDYSDPEQVIVAQDAPAELVLLGAVHFHVLDPDARDLAEATGAIEPGGACWRAQVAPDSEVQPAMGQTLVLQVGEGVALRFFVQLAYEDLHDPAAPNLGADVVPNEALAGLQPGQVLLVQELAVGDA